MNRSQKRLISLIAIAGLAVGASACASPGKPAAPGEGKIGGELNILVMPGYEEEQIIRPFEEEFGVKVNARIYPSSDEMWAMVSASGGSEWDVITPDTPWIERLVEADLVEPIDESSLPALKDYYPAWQNFDQVYVDDQMYGVVSRWGYYGIVYNHDHVSEEEAQSFEVLWNPKYKDKIVLFDWYLPNMGIISRGMGNQAPYDIDEAALGELREKVLSLRPQVNNIAPTNADVIQAMANESSWISLGGEWLQVLLAEDGLPISVTVPKEGGVSWTEAISIMKNAQNPEAAQAYLEYMTRPEVQAKLAWAEAFRTTVPNSKAAEHLTEEQRELLHIQTPEQANAILENVATRDIPEDEKAWQQIWNDFKAG